MKLSMTLVEEPALALVRIEISIAAEAVAGAATDGPTAIATTRITRPASGANRRDERRFIRRFSSANKQAWLADPYLPPCCPRCGRRNVAKPKIGVKKTSYRA